MAGVYLHIPFCKQACHYCDFHFSTSLKKKDELLKALHLELELRSDELTEQQVETIYFGGGTPSLLTVGELQQLIDGVYHNYNVVDNPEITLEANPDDLTNEQIKKLTNTRVNRLSIGVQSFFEEDLKLMNRAHNAQEAEDCIKEARAYFENISIDLIYGIPGMRQERWHENIRKTLSFDVPHISSYALTVEPRTALAHLIEKGIVDPVDDTLAEIHFHQLVEILEEHDFVHYELSNFGKEGYFSKNNSAYWQGKTYLGIGPSAHSFNGEQRSWNIANNTKYMKSLAEGILPSEVETLSTTDRYNEYVMTGLRTLWGVSLEKVEKDFGTHFKQYLLAQSERHLEAHLLYQDDQVIRTTKRGKFLADGIASDLFLLNLS